MAVALLATDARAGEVTALLTVDTMDDAGDDTGDDAGDEDAGDDAGDEDAGADETGAEDAGDDVADVAGDDNGVVEELATGLEPPEEPGSAIGTPAA